MDAQTLVAKLDTNELVLQEGLRRCIDEKLRDGMKEVMAGTHDAALVPLAENFAFQVALFEKRIFQREQQGCCTTDSLPP